MVNGHGRQQPEASQPLWDAATTALQAGASDSEILSVMRLPEPQKSRTKVKLKNLRRQVPLNPQLSKQEALLRLADLRRDELERPIVDATVANANEIKRLFHSANEISNRRSVLKAQLRDINRMINEIDHVGLGVSRRDGLVMRHNQTVAALLNEYDCLSLILNESESVYLRGTKLADRGLMLGGLSVQDARQLGGFKRSDRHIYRSRENLSDPPASEYRFSPTLRDLLHIFDTAQTAIAELRASMDADRQRLMNMPGRTDLP